MRNGSFLILMYHMISEPLSGENCRYTCSPRLFEKHICFLKKKRFNIISMDEVLSHYQNRTSLPERSVAITLDDGFADNYINAFPVIKKYNIPATVFLVAGRIEKTDHWINRREYQPRTMLSWEQARKMRDHGVTFGAHTMNHVRLPDLSAGDAEVEISQSKDVIEKELNQQVFYFAYPYGLYSEESISILRRCGFALSCSTRSGFNSQSTDPFLLRRIEVYGDDSLWKLSHKLTFGMNDAGIMFRLKYYSSRIMARLF